MKATLIANFNWLFADKVLRLLGGLLVGIWVARYLGPEQFGLLNYAIAFVALFGTFAKLGMDQVVVRELSNKPEQHQAILGTVFKLKLLSSLVAVFIILPIAWILQGGDFYFLMLVGLVSVGLIFNAFDAYDLFFQANLQSRYVVLARSISFILFSLVKVMLILGEYSLVYFASAATLEIIVGSLILALIHSYKKTTNTKWHFDWKTMKSLLKDGWPLIICSALVVIHTRIDQVMIGQLLGNTDVGVYSVAIRLSDLWLFVPIIIVQTAMPYLTKLRELDFVKYERRLLQLYSIMFWLGVSVAILIQLLGELLVVLLYGDEFREAYKPLTLIIWTGIFISQSMARGIWMVSENIQIYRLINNLLAVPLNIVLNLALIPVFGVEGAAVASLISIGMSVWIIPLLFSPLRASNKQMLIAIHPKYIFS